MLATENRSRVSIHGRLC